MLRVLALVALLGCADAVNLRHSSDGAMQVESNGSVIDASSFSPAFLAAVDATISPAQHHASLLSAKTSAAKGGLMRLATRGAAELDVEKVVKSIPLPESTANLLRHGTKMAAGANMWRADTDPAIIEKAIVNLNGMVFQSQIRLDAKNDECEEFRAKYTETLEQINGDLARMGEELSNTARAILVHMGGIDANILNNQQTKEELQTEYLAYMEVRNADLIVLQERQTNMAVSAFILVFSACPDAPSAAAMLQTITSANRTAVHDVQTCVNTTGGKTVHFGHQQIESKAQELSDEAQDMLMRFIDFEEHKKGGRRAAQAAEKLEPMAMAFTESIDEDLDDGDVDDAGNDDEQDEQIGRAHV